jgi:hypothetical protein
MKTLMRSTKLNLITEPTNFCGVMGCALIQKSAMQQSGYLNFTAVPYI